MTRKPRRRGAAPAIDMSEVELPSWDGTPHVCGGEFRLVRELTDVPIRGTIVQVEQEFYRCNTCGEERADLGQIDAARQAASRALNHREGLLQPEQIRALRESFGLSQADFEHVLGIGPKTVVRWENGKVLPSQATAALLLLIRRDPSALCFLASTRHVDVAITFDMPTFGVAVPIPATKVRMEMERMDVTSEWGIPSEAVAA